MLKALALILLCQLAGETLVVLFGLPLPGPVLGMLLLFVGLLVVGGPAGELEQTATRLLSLLPLLFVPAGVGVMVYWDLVRASWPVLLVAILPGTLITLLATALAMRLMIALGRRGAGSEVSQQRRGAGHG